ncbi:hypothetical protein TWF506_004173 [Arthrobotrys conoides]|uniref:Uncharacterized protein n=1 Tax=Arthrobotrys conoides TaxID=74498 RepID=A0AAN8NCG5_9PEZI
MSTSTTTDNEAAKELNIKLQAGEMKLFSSFIPSLSSGDYTVVIDHKLDLEGFAQKPLLSTKEFRITAPRYALAPGDVYSSFPHPGHGEEAKVLPHILLSDPHLPWARSLGAPMEKEHPWMGILSFATEELQSRVADILGAKSKLKDSKPSQTLSYSLTLGDLWSLSNEIVLPLDPDHMKKEDDRRPSGEKSTDIVDAVFMTSKMFEQLFCETDGPNNTPRISLKKFQYMSHVRMVNSVGTVSAGPGGAGNVRYGVVVGPRSGLVRPNDIVTDLSKPIPMIAHLFSLEGVQSMDLNIIRSKGYVGLISLYSWVYECLPSTSENYSQALSDLGKYAQPLRLSKEAINEIIKNTNPDPEPSQQATKLGTAVKAEDPNCKWLRDRLEAGYSFISFRPSTGERTAGIFRGALTPKLSSVSTLPKTSNVGSDLQIIDCMSGVPDLTYHLAWELGRGLASSDKVFSAAMLRLRTRINNEAQDWARGGSTDARSKIFGRLRKPREGTGLVRRNNQGRRGQNTLRRWNKRKVHVLDPEDEETDLKADEEIITEIAQITAKICLNKELSRGADEDDDDQSITKEKVVNPDTQNSSAWAVILQWIIDKIRLFNIPNVYLYPEPLALPEEAFRTFHIDEVWMNAFLDGALSVANHRFYNQIDYIRNELKVCINQELSKNQHQIPKWGFIIRSKVILAFPDLRIQAPWNTDTKGREQIARIQRLAPDTLLCLFDRQPGDGLWADKKAIVIKEPPHQQKFSVGDNLGKDELHMKYRLLPTVEVAKAQENAAAKSAGKTKVKYLRGGKAIPDTSPGYELPQIYNWDTRCLNSASLADTSYKLSQTILTEELFKSQQAGSALTGIQLNDAPMTLDVSFLTTADQKSQADNGLRDRQLPVLHYERISAEVSKGHQYATAASLTTPFPRKGNFPFPRIRQGNPPPQPRLRVAAKEVVTPLPQVSQLAAASATSIPTYLEKAVFPLHHYGCNIPVDNPAGIDLVFSISAQKTLNNSIALKSLTVILPAGKNRTDLLRVTRKDATKLTVLPSARPIGKGSRWLAGSRECDGLVKEFSRIPTQDNTQAASVQIPTTTLAVRVVPRGRLCALADMPDLSFVLSGVELNDMISADVKIIFQEEYSVRVEGGEDLQLKWTRPEPVFNYLRVEKQRSI